MKKNKKLFAILTLVAFMMTLMPVMAFAAGTEQTALTLSFAAKDGGKVTVTVGEEADIYSVDKDGKILSATAVIKAVTSGADVVANTFKKDAYYLAVTKNTSVTTEDTISDVTKANIAQYDLDADDFAAANTVAKAASGVYAKTTSADANSEDELEYEVELVGADGQPAQTLGGSLYVWAERASEVVSDIDTLEAVAKAGLIVKPAGGSQTGFLEITAVPADGVFTVKVKSTQAGKVTIKAAINPASVTAANDLVVDKNLLSANGSVTGEFSAQSTSANEIKFAVVSKIGDVVSDKTSGAAANSIDKYTVTATVKTKDGQAVKDQKVTISANKSGVDLEKEEAKTDNRGKVEFDVTATKSGDFVINVVAGSASSELTLSFGATKAISADVTKAPNTTVAVDSEVTFKVSAKDVYGNKVKDSNQFTTYVAKLGDKEYKMTPDGFDTNGDHIFKFTPSKVGNYAVTFKLDNGKKATTTLEVAEQGKIVEMQVNYDANTVNLGASTNEPEVIEIDASGVTKTVQSANIKYAVSGKGVLNFNSNNGTITVSSDDKYAGEVLTVTAVDKTNNIAATTTLTIADAAQGLAFTGSNGVTGQDANIPFSVVDANGNKVALGTAEGIKVTSTAVVTAKPDGANATAVVNKDFELKDKGVAILQVNSNKDGEVKVQVMIEVNYPADTAKNVLAHTEYYTGIATVTFGDKAIDSANSTATMIIGSTTFVANGKVVTSDVAPFVKDGRTFLPIRALGEALGAEVAFDEATNVVTIKLDGKTVTMTLGSAVMTVGDKVVTMDTAAYATAEGRTVVPVRFAAEALGFNVEAVYATDGTTSAVNFSK